MGLRVGGLLLEVNPSNKSERLVSTDQAGSWSHCRDN